MPTDRVRSWPIAVDIWRSGGIAASLSQETDGQPRRQQVMRSVLADSDARRLRLACGVPELGRRSWPGLLRGSLVLVDEAAEDGPAHNPLRGEVRGWVIRAGRAELAASVWPPPVVMGLGPGQDGPQMALAEEGCDAASTRPLPQANAQVSQLCPVVESHTFLAARRQAANRGFHGTPAVTASTRRSLDPHRQGIR